MYTTDWATSSYSIRTIANTAIHRRKQKYFTITDNCAAINRISKVCTKFNQQQNSVIFAPMEHLKYWHLDNDAAGYIENNKRNQNEENNGSRKKRPSTMGDSCLYYKLAFEP